MDIPDTQLQTAQLLDTEGRSDGVRGARLVALHDALAGPVDLGLVERLDLHAGTAAAPVEAGQEVAGDVLPPHSPIDPLDAVRVLAGGGASAVEPDFEGAVGDGQT
nr:hypothetical protein StreXyl84_80330 [Streptomyces sp. Xyl84]